ncbi:transcription antitermination factor NusB [Leeia sp. TBRC 13508]|uniref:Transcription antitermination protein NusB n=1 Tax=Leeia speluncae TaxID=2884804 RepID=A0ABS8D2Q6_9NEIS|nr:transcription antitermination factor NusB [Leeia speluncae]MCB6182470.1 transcription antitermination factor NusB [Leeia speluncae]
MSQGQKKSARRRSRELVVQGLYQWQLTDAEALQIELNLRDEIEDFNKCDIPLFKNLLNGCLREIEYLKTEVSVFLDRPYEEISPVERAVLLLATYEFIHTAEVPYRVVMNEAIELAKTFGGTDGHRYVNGVLDKLAAKLRATEVNAPRA